VSAGSSWLGLANYESRTLGTDHLASGLSPTSATARYSGHFSGESLETGLVGGGGGFELPVPVREQPDDSIQ
jgi:hypothetical protein